MRALRRGHSGNDVRYLQYKLGLAVDGSFGPATEKALKAKQTACGLKPDGSCGPATQKALGIGDFLIWIFDPKKDRIWFAGNPYNSKAYPTKTLKQWANEQKADYVFNLAFFNMGGSGLSGGIPIKGRTLQYVRGNGKDLGYGGTAEKLTVDEGNICSGWKVIAKDKKVVSAATTSPRCMNANGVLKDGRYFQIQSVTKCTERALTDAALKSLDVKLMLRQDSGGSTGFYDRGKNVLLAGEKEGSNGRSVATVVCVKKGRG